MARFESVCVYNMLLVCQGFQAGLHRTGTALVIELVMVVLSLFVAFDGVGDSKWGLRRPGRSDLPSLVGGL